MVAYPAVIRRIEIVKEINEAQESCSQGTATYSFSNP